MLFYGDLTDKDRAAKFDGDGYNCATGGVLGGCALAEQLKPVKAALAVAPGQKILDC